MIRNNRRFIKMRKIQCNNGKCWEVKKGNPVAFEDLFEDGSIVDNIEKDLWKHNFYGN